MQFTPLGDLAVTITLGDTIDEATHRLVRAATRAIMASDISGVTDIVPAFASVTVHYNPLQIRWTESASPYEQLVSTLRELLDGVRVEDLPEPRLV